MKYKGAVMNDSQMGERGLRHLLSLENMPKEIVIDILERADEFLSAASGGAKKVPVLRGKTIFNLFFENSTRTRTTFEIAAKRLSADVVNLNVLTSSQSKGESLLDMVNNLVAMQADMFVVRHSQSGAAHLIAKHVPSGVHVINAGDGRHSHPTQGLLDVFSIRQYKNSFDGLRVAIVGDVLHSRVARSQIHVLKTLGVDDIRVCGPRTLVPETVSDLGVTVFHEIEKALLGVDVIIMLRLQHERMSGTLLPSAQDFFRGYGLTEERLLLADNDVIVMHPGPINRGVEIASSVADGPRSIILPQVTYGIAVRMSVMAVLLGNSL